MMQFDNFFRKRQTNTTTNHLSCFCRLNLKKSVEYLTLVFRVHTYTSVLDGNNTKILIAIYGHFYYISVFTILHRIRQ